MSRIGKQAIEIPAGVKLEVDGAKITAMGPKGNLEARLLPGLSLEIEESAARIVKKRDDEETNRTHGLMRTLVGNIVTGVSKGYEKQLEINGVGYRANVGGGNVNLTLGYSHPIAFALPQGIEAKVERNIITISGADKQVVGQVAANIRALRKPEPYKGKGIKYINERIRRKAGKTAGK
jgi:large subunit ribosomal protein L6